MPMPTTTEILEGLRSISNNYTLISIYWHIVFYIVITLILFSVWRPSYRMAGILLTLPFVTVAALALNSGNPFNGFLFTILVVLWMLYCFKLTQEHAQYSTALYRIAGILLLLFGLWYPHFIEGDSVLVYLYAAPTGLIPCPTLSIAIGIALIYNGFNSNPLKIILICFGLFYGLFGILKLGVYLDVVLLIGTIVLLIQFLHKRK
jgi:hypothetical protein